MSKKKNLTTSKKNAVLFGVIGGIGEYIGVDPVLLRILAIILIFAGFGMIIPVYFFLGIFVIPEENDFYYDTDNNDKKGTFDSDNYYDRYDYQEDDWSDF